MFFKTQNKSFTHYFSFLLINFFTIKMSAFLIPKNKLEKYKKQEEIIKLTAEQIIKDFNQFGLNVSFSGIIQYAYDELFEQLLTHVADLLNNNHKKLYSLLYQIDLSENKIRKMAAENQNREAHKIITELIIERELKKVGTRIYFKENPDALKNL